MSLTVITIASLHAALPWIAGQQTKKMRWVAVATCIACCAALILGNGAYVIPDLLATGVGFFIGRGYVRPRYERKQLQGRASSGTRPTQQWGTNPIGPSPTVSQPASEAPETVSSGAVIYVTAVMCFAVAVIGLFIAAVLTGADTGEFVIPTTIALFFICLLAAVLPGRRPKKFEARPGPTLKVWVPPKNVLTNYRKTDTEFDRKLNQLGIEVKFAPPKQTVSPSSSEGPAALIDVVAVCRVVCPHCGTMFRVASDQLGLRGGIVRCGACQEIFDGRATLQ